MRSKIKYLAIVLAVLLMVLTGCGGMSDMPFNGDIMFHDVSMTVPEKFIRDSAQSNADLWIFEHDNYSQILLMSRDDVVEDTPEKMEEMMDFYGTIGGTSTKYEEYAHAYRAEYTKDDMACQEVMFIYGDNLYTITLRGATAEEFSKLLDSVEVGA